MPPQKMVPHPP